MITRKQAIEYSIIKWEYAYETGCDFLELGYWLFNNHKKIFYLNSGCGLCEIYRYPSCKKCPLTQCGENCFEDGTYFDRWVFSETKQERKDYAMLILALIKN
jgi:hypothetical protein